jgi:methionine sulfoxide reductase catalytic subunit
MLIRTIRSWEIPEREATPEALFFSRRTLLGGIGGAAGLALSGFAPTSGARAEDAADPNAALYPAKKNEAFKLDREVTPEKVNGQYNNFYEFGGSKNISAAAQGLKVRPWMIKIDGMVEKPIEISADDLIKAMPLEERLYRHRCVEAWSMAVPWTGFPLKALLAMSKPTGSAKYLRMETFMDTKMAPGQRSLIYPWPYVEGLRLDEAANDLAFLVTGAYGKPLPKQHGAPLRLATPWKFGFKSVKSIAKFTFTDKQPVSFWQQLQGGEYGFWANVNPKVDHPRWSQASEEVIGTGERRPTLLYNGYGAEVASLYAGMEGEKIYF